MALHALQLPDQARVCNALVRRRELIACRWQESIESAAEAIVLVPAGLVLDVEGSDQHYGYRVHDDHYYLSGCRDTGQVLAFDPEAAPAEQWTLFAFRPSQQDLVWHGHAPTLEALGASSGIEHVLPVAALEGWLGARAGRITVLLGSGDLLESPVGYGVHPECLVKLAFDGSLSARFQHALVQSRRGKDAVEIDLMRAAATATRHGHIHAMECARAGMSERALQVEIDFAFQRAGAERSAYGTIAAAGANAAILHATPGSHPLAEGELVLVDAGAEVLGYDCDVTRTWPVGARLTGEQRAIYDIVLEVQVAAIAGVRAGVEYRDLHMEACLGIASGLADLGLLRGRAEDLVAQDAHAVFFPHGIGHLIGLATHDVGGRLEGRTASERPGLKYLRADLPLAEGYVVTIEPGIYFIPALLTDPELRERHRDVINWVRVDAMHDFGGIRIEDDVLVGADGPDVLTASIPKQIEDLEALRS